MILSKFFFKVFKVLHYKIFYFLKMWIFTKGLSGEWSSGLIVFF